MAFAQDKEGLCHLAQFPWNMNLKPGAFPLFPGLFNGHPVQGQAFLDKEQVELAGTSYDPLEDRGLWLTSGLRHLLF